MDEKVSHGFSQNVTAIIHLASSLFYSIVSPFFKAKSSRQSRTFMKGLFSIAAYFYGDTFTRKPAKSL